MNLVYLYCEYMAKYEQVVDYLKNLKPFEKSHREVRVKSDIFLLKGVLQRGF